MNDSSGLRCCISTLDSEQQSGSESPAEVSRDNDFLLECLWLIPHSSNFSDMPAPLSRHESVASTVDEKAAAAPEVWLEVIRTKDGYIDLL